MLFNCFLVEKCVADSTTNSDSDATIICTDDSDTEPYFITDESDSDCDGESAQQNQQNVQVNS